MGEKEQFVIAGSKLKFFWWANESFVSILHLIVSPHEHICDIHSAR